MKHGSLFSGIGGFDLAAEWMGWENVFHCEIDEFPRKILNYYWPNSISYHDIKTTDFSVHRNQFDILTGGFPCQPYSAAGKRLGKEDDRHLWPFMLETIRSIQPRWVVGENVRGLVNWSNGLVFEEVQTDLETEGYEVQAFILPAAGIGAPHRRDRVWFVAYANNGDDRRNTGKNEGESKEERLSKWDKVRKSTESSEVFGDVADSKNIRWDCGKYRQEQSRWTSEKIFSSYWENFPTQSPICGGDDEFPPELDGITFPKWRNGSIKGYGNAVVPALVYEIFKTIEEYESVK